MQNPYLSKTLDDCVMEVLAILTGLELTYRPETERYYAVTRQINRALRAHALEAEFSYYADTLDVGPVRAGDLELRLSSLQRPRIIGDDALRLVDEDGRVKVMASFLPRDALAKYDGRQGLWVSSTRNTIRFSRPINRSEDGLTALLPVMREPRPFVLPKPPQDNESELQPVPDDVREQVLDYDYPDVILLRAAYLYAMTDPIMQPRAQTLEAQFKDLMYQVIARDQANTDSPYMNDFQVPISNDVFGGSGGWNGFHHHSDERR